TMYVLTGKAVLFSLDDVSEASLIADLSDAQKDFNAQVLIPVITMLTLIITFLSTYDVVSTSMEERSRQFGLLRCMGMTQKSVFLRLAAEALAFVLASMLIGFIIGVFIYWLIITIQINVFEMRTFYAFNVHKVIDAITLNPYAYPLIAGFVCAFAAVLMPAFRHIFLSPLEIFSGLRHSKKIKAYRPRQSAMRLLSGRLHSKLVQNLTTVIIVITLMSAGFFGFLYFSAQAESSNSGYQKALKNANLHGLDYLAAKDFNKASCGAAQLNLHGTGMREKELQKLKNSGYADKIRYAIEAKSTKAVYTESEENTKIINAIEGCGLHPWYDFLIDLHNKSLLHQGYAENERLFNIPTVGISKEGLEELKGFLAKGSINYDALAAGEEVLILEVEGKGITNPYNIGDIITMTDAVIDNIDVENYDFSSGMIPEGLEPHFYYVYTNPDASPELGEDGKPVEISGYAFGKRNDYTVKVGGRLVVTDETLAQFYFSEPLQGDCGFNFLCHKDAFEYWGLPDRNYTKVGAALGNAGNIEAFDRIWFSAMGNSRDMISVSTADIRISMRDSVYVNMSTFFAMIVMLVALGLVGIVNTIKLRMRKQAQTFSMLRAIGMRITDIKMLVVRQNLRYPLIGALLCWIPVAVFEAVKRYIYDMLESGVYSGMIAPVNGKIQFPWYKSFPLHIDLLKQPLVPAFLITFAVMTLIMVIASLLPIRWLGKQSIVETIRRDDF
ncbi:MAG: FtsX-like permease family protein, partial [Christensenellales bacterium]